MHLEAPVTIRKVPHEHLHGFFQSREVLDSDPRDLFNFLRTCRKLYRLYEDVLRNKQLLCRFYVNISRPLPQESQLAIVSGIGKGKLRTFVFNPKSQNNSQPTIEYNFRDPCNFDPKTALCTYQQNDNRDALVDLLSQHCLKWVRTFIHWPPGQEGGNGDPTVGLLLDLQNNFLGVINFHQYDPAGRNPEEARGTVACGAQRFWAMICHCKVDRFLVLQSVCGTVWDRTFACPRVAVVTNN